MSLCSSSHQPPAVGYMSNAISSSRESNPSPLCHLLAVPLGHVADEYWLKTSLAAREVVGSIPGPVNLDTVSCRQQLDTVATFFGAVLPRRSTAEMCPTIRYTLVLRRNYLSKTSCSNV